MLGIPVPPECTADPETLEAVPDSADEFLFIGNFREDRRAIHVRLRCRRSAARTCGSTWKGARRRGCVPSYAEFESECVAVESLIRIRVRDVRTGEPIVESVQRLGGANPLDPEGDRYADLLFDRLDRSTALEHPELQVVTKNRYRSMDRAAHPPIADSRPGQRQRAL